MSGVDCVPRVLLLPSSRKQDMEQFSGKSQYSYPNSYTMIYNAAVYKHLSILRLVVHRVADKTKFELKKGGIQSSKSNYILGDVYHKYFLQYHNTFVWSDLITVRGKSLQSAYICRNWKTKSFTSWQVNSSKGGRETSRKLNFCKFCNASSISRSNAISVEHIQYLSNKSIRQIGQ